MSRYTKPNMSKNVITGYEIEQCGNFDIPSTVLLTMKC